MIAAGSGDLDMVVIGPMLNAQGTGGDFVLRLNQRSGGYEQDLQATIDDTNGASYTVVVADVDGDGDLDVIGIARESEQRTEL